VALTVEWYVVAGTTPEATTEAAMFENVALLQVNAVPATAVVTVNVAVLWLPL